MSFLTEQLTSPQNLVRFDRGVLLHESGVMGVSTRDSDALLLRHPCLEINGTGICNNCMLPFYSNNSIGRFPDLL